MDDNLVVFIFILACFLYASLLALAAHHKPPEQRLPISARRRRLEVQNPSDARNPSPTNADVNEPEPPEYAQDEEGKSLVLPPPQPAAMRDEGDGGSNSGRPQKKSSTLLPMYTDGADR